MSLLHKYHRGCPAHSLSITAAFVSGILHHAESIIDHQLQVLYRL